MLEVILYLFTNLRESLYADGLYRQIMDVRYKYALVLYSLSFNAKCLSYTK